MPDERYELRCPDCGYTTIVKGGKGAAWAGATTTIVCGACRELSDAIIWRLGYLVDIEPRCPHGDDHPVALWIFPGPCPKCGAQMRRAIAHDRHRSPHRLTKRLTDAASFLTTQSKPRVKRR